MSDDNRPLDGDRNADQLASAEQLAAQDRQDNPSEFDDAERDIASVNSGRRKRGFVPLLVMGTILAALLFLLFSTDDADPVAQDTVRTDEQATIRSTQNPPSLPAPPPLPVEPEPQPEPEPQALIRTDRLAPEPPPRPNQVGGEEVMTPAMRKRQGQLLAVAGDIEDDAQPNATNAINTGNLASAGSSAGGGFLGGGQGGGNDRLAQMTQPVRLQGEAAGLIANRHMMITKGTIIPCVLETAIDSTVPGFTSCRITRDVYSTSGKVVLIDRGSRFLGQYQSGISLGETRLFVLWTRIETPKGVIINVDSPGTGPLGKNGHAGQVDTRFFERFGAAAAFSLFTDLGDYLANQASNSSTGGDSFSFENSSGSATKATEMILEQYLDIPPRLTKNQGELISITVARDLNFSGVYSLAAQ